MKQKANSLLEFTCRQEAEIYRATNPEINLQVVCDHPLTCAPIIDIEFEQINPEEKIEQITDK